MAEDGYGSSVMAFMICEVDEECNKDDQGLPWMSLASSTAEENVCAPSVPITGTVVGFSMVVL